MTVPWWVWNCVWSHFPFSPHIIPTCDIKGPTLFFNLSSFPSPFSATDGNDKSRRVWPVGAVSNTTTSKFIVFTNLTTEGDSFCNWITTWLHIRTIKTPINLYNCDIIYETVLGWCNLAPIMPECLPGNHPPCFFYYAWLNGWIPCWYVKPFPV